jgi:myo-inositol-1(or 4)-monophosphatase
MPQKNYNKILIPIIKKAGEKAKKNWQTFKRQESTLKSKTQIVTATDKEIERYLIKNIKKHFPSHAFLGEEFGRSKNKSDYLWIIDPIDGTTNFSIHNPLWSISVALACRQKIIFGAIYIPVLEEMFWAEKGKGAYINNKKIKPSPLNKNKLIHTFCHGEKRRDLKIALNYYKQQKMKSLDCRQLGSAAIELAYVASGRVDSIVIPGTNAWDVAGGVLIAREAGANVVNFSGKNWNLNDQDIIACQPKIKKDIIKKIKSAME